MVSSIPGGDVTAVAVVLALIGISAFVLDAFEIIFVIVPIVIPPLLIRVADARWVAVLVLLTLQASFLLPPFGYALMMVRGVLKEPAAYRGLLRALAPYLAAQWLLLAVVLLFPQLTHTAPVRRREHAGAGGADVGCGVQQAPAGDDPATRAARGGAEPPLSGSRIGFTRFALFGGPRAQVLEELFHLARQRFRRGGQVVGGGEHGACGRIGLADRFAQRVDVTDQRLVALRGRLRVSRDFARRRILLARPRLRYSR